MDNIIKNLSTILMDGYQTASENIYYSLILLFLALITGIVIARFSHKNKIQVLEQQIIDEKHAAQRLERKNEELVSTQTDDAKIIADHQQQIEQLSQALQQSEELQTALKQQDEFHTKAVDDKQIEINQLQSTLNDKTDQIEKLQNQIEKLQTELLNQKNQLTEYHTEQEKIEEIEQEATQFSKEFTIVKQQLHQLESELDVKTGQIEAFEKTSQFLEKEELNATEKEHTIQLHNQQLAHFNEQLLMLLAQSKPEINIDDTSDGKNKIDGIIGKVVNLFSSIDHALGTDTKPTHEEEAQTDDVWQQHQKLVNQVINQFSERTEQAEPQDTEVEKEDITAKMLKEMTEKTDQFQEKLKGLYQKISS